MCQNEILQETCNCYLLLEYHQLLLIMFKADCIDLGISRKIKFAFSLIQSVLGLQ